MNLSKLREISEEQGSSGMLQSTGSQRVGHDSANEQQQGKIFEKKQFFKNCFIAFFKPSLVLYHDPLSFIVYFF